MSICIFYKKLLTGYCIYTVITQAVHVLDTACLRTCNENDMSCVLTSTRGQSWNTRQPYTFGTHYVCTQYTFGERPCTGSRRASTRGQAWCVRKPYTFITRSVYIQYTSCVRAVDGPVHAVNPGV